MTRLKPAPLRDIKLSRVLFAMCWCAYAAAYTGRLNLSAAIAADTVFLLRATEKDVEAFLAEPVLANHPAVVGKRVYPLGLTSFRIDPYSGRQIIERLRESFARR